MVPHSHRVNAGKGLEEHLAGRPLLSPWLTALYPSGLCIFQEAILDRRHHDRCLVQVPPWHPELTRTLIPCTPYAVAFVCTSSVCAPGGMGRALLHHLSPAKIAVPARGSSLNKHLLSEQLFKHTLSSETYTPPQS